MLPNEVVYVPPLADVRGGVYHRVGAGEAAVQRSAVDHVAEFESGAGSLDAIGSVGVELEAADVGALGGAPRH